VLLKKYHSLNDNLKELRSGSKACKHLAISSCSKIRQKILSEKFTKLTKTCSDSTFEHFHQVPWFDFLCVEFSLNDLMFHSFTAKRDCHTRLRLAKSGMVGKRTNRSRTADGLKIFMMSPIFN
jgi:hypothetical protein